MKSVVVTGSNGFIGINLIKRLLKENIHIYAFVSGKEKINDNLKDNDLITIVPCNLETFSIFDIDIPANIDVLYHLAWIGVSPDCRSNFDIQFRNIAMTLNCLYLAKFKKIHRFIMPGSTNEYLYSNKVINEKTNPTPRDDYGAIKVALRFIAKQFAVNNNIEFVYTVISGIYSEQRRDSNVISYTIDKLLKKELPLLTKLEQKWDYVHIDDAIEALYLIGDRGRDGKLYTIGHGDNWALINYIKIISRKIDSSLPLGIGAIPYSSSELPMSCVDLSDLREDTGFEPKINFEDGISRMIMNWTKFEDK
ncbi:NAD-dependent epimerase/dehydratase family protein [Treponema pedis]|uniref:NAD-dependent epimerase/dehydratase family protein n=1 Tax=Treponema pedis TaxID=409322 RepID=UPI0003F60F1C|nr:NAD(P)-dependent oxidoreductase [Treponema pedis]